MMIVFRCQSCGVVFDNPNYHHEMVYDPSYPNQFDEESFPICPFCESGNIDEEEADE